MIKTRRTVALALAAMMAAQPGVLAAQSRSRSVASQAPSSPAAKPLAHPLPPRLPGVEPGLTKTTPAALAATPVVAVARPAAAPLPAGVQPAVAAEAAAVEKAAEALGDALPADLRVFVTRHGRDPVETDLAGLPALLTSDPAYAAELARRGRARLVGLDGDGRAAAEKALREAGVRSLDAEKAPPQPRQAEISGPEAKAGSILTAPLREAVYVGRVLAAAAATPTKAEIVGGILTKGPAFAFGVVYWSGKFLPAHPIAFGIVTGLLFAVEAFHGVWINTWQNVQNIIGRQRGVIYQTAFNLLYMQGSAALFRTISYGAGVAETAPWHASYWRDMGIVTFVGTFSGVLGYNGLNDLYTKGRISRSARSWIQQGRDFFFLIQGNFFAVGVMKGFWPVFLLSIALDITLYVLSRALEARPALYVADAAIAKSDGFRALYPVNPGPQDSPLTQAWKAMLYPLTPFAAAARALWRKISGGSR